MSAWADLQRAYEEMSFVEKIKFVKENALPFVGNNLSVRHLEWEGYLAKIEKHKICSSGGEFYVYMWKHAWGDPFYVGSGKGGRWTKKTSRCNDFYLHLDQADAVVYKILDGVDSKTARLFEKYVSVNLVEAGYTLANGDNNPEYMTENYKNTILKDCEKMKEHELLSDVQSTVLNILMDDPKCDYFITDKFIMEYGADYFSRTYMK